MVTRDMGMAGWTSCTHLLKEISAYLGSSEFTCIDTDEVTDANSCSVLSVSWASRNASRVHVRDTYLYRPCACDITGEKNERK